MMRSTARGTYACSRSRSSVDHLNTALACVQEGKDAQAIEELLEVVISFRNREYTNIVRNIDDAMNRREDGQ